MTHEHRQKLEVDNTDLFCCESKFREPVYRLGIHCKEASSKAMATNWWPSWIGHGKPSPTSNLHYMIVITNYVLEALPTIPKKNISRMS
jgi:hypothetical protein